MGGTGIFAGFPPPSPVPSASVFGGFSGFGGFGGDYFPSPVYPKKV